MIFFAVAATFLTGFFASLLYGIPAPHVHDEFAFLLGADTLLAGRLANPGLPHPDAFETFHILVSPSYASKYPLGQAIFLAIGQLAGAPIIGVWLSSGLAVGACGWAISADSTRKETAIAMITGVVVIGISYWNNSYWGGSVAAMGGALFFGAVRRIAREVHWQTGFAAGMGSGLLFLTRPYEGFIFCALVLAANAKQFVWSLRRDRQDSAAFPYQPFIAFAVVFCPAVLLTLAQNHAITGNPLTFPHALYSKTYLASRVFMFQDLNVPEKVPFGLLARFNEIETANFMFRKSHFWSSFINIFSGVFLDFFLYPVFVWFALFSLFRNDWVKIGMQYLGPAITGVATCIATTVPALSHYYAPFAVLIIGAVAFGVSKVSEFATNRFFSRTIAILAFGAAIGVRVEGFRSEFEKQSHGWQSYRNAMKREMEATGDRHLVFVEYNKDHIPHAEWVFNDADLGEARVIWARRRSPNLDKAVYDALRKDKERMIAWRLDPDDKHGLVPYEL